MPEKRIRQENTIFHKSVMGIDEAGKGCVIGPLVIGAVIWSNDNNAVLENTVFLDSKVYSSNKQKNERKNLAFLVSEHSQKTIIEVLAPSEIDKAILEHRMYQKQSKTNLNILEISRIAEIISFNPCSTVYIDSLGKPPYFIQTIKKILEVKHMDKIEKINVNPIKQNMEIHWRNKTDEKNNITTIIAENKADSKYKIVSASSIIAKVYRDEQIRLIEEENNLPAGILASGYANPQLLPFLLQFESKIKNKEFNFIRYQWNWDPLQSIIKPKKRSLLNFSKKENMLNK